MAPPLLRFLRGPADAEMCGWSGDWPPPEELLYVVGKQSGLTSWTERYIIEEKIDDPGVVVASFHIYAYKRSEFSKLPPEIDSFDHVVRAARYEFVQELSTL